MFIPTPGLDMAVERWWSRWVQRGRAGRARFSPEGAGWILTYTARYRLSAFLIFAGFSSLYGFTLREGKIFKTDSWSGLAIAVMSVLIWCVSLTIFAGSLIERITVTPQHLRRRSWRGRQQVAWTDVNLMFIDRGHRDVRIGVQGGTVIEISFYLDGLRAVADALEQHRHVPAAFLEAVIPERVERL